MKFSVIIPCYHSEDFIAEAIKSVQCQLFKDYELLVMCESDDAASIEAVKACGVDPVVGEFRSSGAARNASTWQKEHTFCSSTVMIGSWALIALTFWISSHGFRWTL